MDHAMHYLYRGSQAAIAGLLTAGMAMVAIAWLAGLLTA